MAIKRVNPTEAGELSEKVVNISRVAKVTKGGRTFSFSALVIVGDGNGAVGYGLGKARDVSESISKAIEDGKKNLIKFPLDRKSTRLNSSHVAISYAVFCLKKKKQTTKEYN